MAAAATRWPPTDPRHWRAEHQALMASLHRKRDVLASIETTAKSLRLEIADIQRHAASALAQVRLLTGGAE